MAAGTGAFDAVIFQNGVEFLFPQTCAVCSALIRPKSPGLPPQPLCDFCCPWTNGLEFISEGCPWCQSPAIDHSIPCSVCLRESRACCQIHSLFWYEGKAQIAVKAFKYAAERRLGQVFAEMIVERWLGFSGCGPGVLPDLLVPVPSSRASFFQRGYQPTAILGKRLAQLLGYEFSTMAMSTRGSKVPQAALSSIKERKENVQGIFRAQSRVVSGKTILLIDDVVTTGQTLESAARTLLDAGASSVLAQTICRAPNFRRYQNDEVIDPSLPAAKSAA